MSHLRGADIRENLTLHADVVVVGSGPAGSSAALVAAKTGARVVVVEAGPAVPPERMPIGAFPAMALMYRNMGASVSVGASPIPLVQGRMVGGSSPINGAICWRLPRDVYDEWVRADAAFADAVPWQAIVDQTDAVETLLNVAPTDPNIAGRKNELMAIGAESLGLEHRRIRRNVRNCRGSGRCMQGCPTGAKQSADRSLLAHALDLDTTLVSATEVCELVQHNGRVVAVVARSAGGAQVRVHASRAVILAASAIQTPSLLLANRIRQGPVGRNFQCHPGVSMTGHFPEPVRMWQGATQGHEVIGLRKQGLKFEALGFGLAVQGGRLPGVGSALSREIERMAHSLDWGVAIRAQARGRVRRIFGKTLVSYAPTSSDLHLFRWGLTVLGQMMFAAGATSVSPGVRGFSPNIRHPTALEGLVSHGPARASAYTAAITHMFGTCAMGSNPDTSVVGLDFQHRAVGRLYIADSSVFPTSIGVNPQVPIMAMAALCAQHAVSGVSR